MTQKFLATFGALEAQRNALQRRVAGPPDPVAGARTAAELLSEARWRLAAVLWRHASHHGAPTPLLEALLAGRDAAAVLGEFGIPQTDALLVALRFELDPPWVS